MIGQLYYYNGTSAPSPIFEISNTNSEVFITSSEDNIIVITGISPIMGGRFSSNGRMLPWNASYGDSNLQIIERNKF